MSFAHPLWLLIAIAAAAVLWRAGRGFERRRDAQALAYSNVAFALESMRPSRWPGALFASAWMAGIAILLVSLAGPRFPARVPVKDGTVILCIDTSGSMRAHDLEPTRWLAAKAAARSFVDAVPAGTRVGLVTFATGASLIAAPTSDIDQVRAALDRVPPPNGATAMGDALELAAEQMPARGKRIIVLMTDGVNNRGADPLATSVSIGGRGIVIYTVGVGTSGSGEIIPGTNELADLDSDALRTIASNAGGDYAEARDAGALRSTFQRLAFDTVWEARRVDGSFAVAVSGGFLLALALLSGLAVGRIP